MKMQNKIVLCMGMLFSSVYVFSQTSEQDSVVENIDIPDVSTTIEGVDVPVDKSAIPDFTLILPESEPDFLLSVELPEVELLESDIEIDDVNADNEFSAIALEGIVGGGYPGYFLGEFSVFQNTGKNPFEIRFSHEAQNGIGRHLASEGYSNTETNLYGHTTVSFAEKYTSGGAAWYDTGSVGLQGKSSEFYNVSHQFVGANLFFSIMLPSSWTLGFQAEGEFSNRYLGFIDTPSISIPTNSDVFTGVAGISLDWNPDFMDLAFDGGYQYSRLDVQNIFSVHRINFDVEVAVPVQEMLTLSGKIGLTYSKDVNVPVLIPFSIAGNFVQPYLNLSIFGGLETAQIDGASLQKRYPFVYFHNAIFEQSEWFVRLNSVVPFLEKFTFNGNLNFETTAFDQGTLLPNYDAQNMITGMYDFLLENLLIFDSALSVSGQFGTLGFSVGWDAAWLDVLPEENAHEVYLTGSVVSQEGKWGVQVGITEAFSGDYIPNIGASAFYNIAPSFQLELKVEDVVYLFSGKDRMYAGDFVTDSGSIALFAKLHF